MENYYEKHYEQCKKYIEMCSNRFNYTPKEMSQMTKQQRLSENEFIKAMQGRVNLRYPDLCREKKTQKGQKSIPFNLPLQ